MSGVVLGLGIVLLVVGTAASIVAVRCMHRAGPRQPPDPQAQPAGPAERRRRAAMDGLPLIALRVEGSGRVAEANRLARARFPFLRPGLALLEAFSEHELAGRVAESIRSMRPAEFQVRLFAGGRRTYRVAVAPYELEGGLREANVFLTDTSEAVAYQELRSQFVANVSHELRTPLTGLRGLLEALEDPGMDPETQGRFVERARRETQRLEALITDILFLSELEATHGLPSTERSDMRQAALQVVEALAGAAAEHGVEVEVDASAPAWTPLTERMSRTVVGNLLENAVRYAGPGARARVAVLRSGGNVVVEVADDGAGIAERHLPHVFERFYRADPSRSKRLGGTGLGLSIVKHIAERFGGGAGATSREGFGTTVRVTLPVATAPEEPAAAVEEQPRDAASPARPVL
jgi:two-component system phosphate regulon sensor histidine kinase PhoR